MPVLGSLLTFALTSIKGRCKKKRFFLETFPNCVKAPTHPRVFVRFGRTKGEIQVEKGDFQADLGGFEWFGPCLGISQVNIFQQGSLLFVIKI